MSVRMPVIAKPFFAAAAVVVAVLVAQPAAAQFSIGSPDGFSIGSPGGPQRVELGVGAFDITPSNRKNAGTQGDFRGEFHFGDVFIPFFSPFLGAERATTG